MIKAILTEIAGTTTSLSFVNNVLFPYCYERMEVFFLKYHNEPEVLACVHEMERRGEATTPFETISRLRQWILEDTQQPTLKCIQGLMWQHAYRDGELKGHIFEDAAEVLKRWRYDGLPVHLFSSLAVREQKLLFAHTEYGDLSKTISGHFDSRLRTKNELETYQRMAQEMVVDVCDVLFLSASVEALGAARLAGMHTLQLVRDETVATANHQTIEKFYDIAL